MKKLGIFLFVLLGLFITTNTQTNVKAETADTLIIHYHRFDPNYAGWQLWLWPHEPTPGDG